jgi:LPS sulfotransferase NodH
MPRSGSSLLCELLAATEMAGAPTEFFDLNQMNEFRRIWGSTTLDEYLDALLAKKTSPNGIFGIKAHYHQLARVLKDVELDAWLPNLHLVYIRRKDHVRQAVSFALATQTEQWTSLHDRPAERPTYDRDQIRALLERIEREEVAWERYFADSGAPLFRVIYEDLVEATEKTVIDVMRFFDIGRPTRFELPSPTLERQADALNDEWTARYLAAESG